MLGIKQDALAFELGEDWNQQKISLLEQKETIELALLEQLSKVLKVPVEAIENFDENAAVNIINSSFTSNDNSAHFTAASHFTYNPVINPFEEWKTAMEDNKKLYERLLESEREKVALLEKIINGKG